MISSELRASTARSARGHRSATFGPAGTKLVVLALALGALLAVLSLAVVWLREGLNEGLGVVGLGVGVGRGAICIDT